MIDCFDYSWSIVSDPQKAEQIENSLSAIISSNPDLDLDTIGIHKDYEEMENRVVFGGFQALSWLVFLFGVVNLINTTLSNQMSRKRENSVFRAIGLTRKQLCQMTIYEGICYIEDVACFPQAYAAAATMLHTLVEEPKAVILDIGGFTADYLLMKNGEIDLTSCDSLENGVILLYNKVRSKVNSELDLLLDEGDVDAILMGKKTQYPDAAIRLTEQMAQEFINDLFSTLRERMLDLQYCKVVFVGGGAILLKRQIETSGKVGAPFFVPKINANADGYEYLYRIETAGR